VYAAVSELYASPPAQPGLGLLESTKQSIK
jgi:hypothetical protein